MNISDKTEPTNLDLMNVYQNIESEAMSPRGGKYKSRFQASIFTKAVLFMKGSEFFVHGLDNSSSGKNSFYGDASKLKMRRKLSPRKTIGEFAKSTSFHGIGYITRKNYHWCETFMWVGTVAFALISATTLILQSWTHFNNNPTVVSIEKNYREWEINFPAATVCFERKMNSSKAHRFIEEKWNADVNSSAYARYEDFLNAATNLSYYNLKDFKRFADHEDIERLSGEEIATIARQLMNEMEFFSANKRNVGFFDVITEMGQCYTYAGNVSYYLTLNQETPPPYELMTCNYETPICSVRVEKFSSAFAVYVHSPYEVPDIGTAPLIVAEEHEVDTSFVPYEMTAAPEVKDLRISQRKCRFTDEPLEGDRFYSYNSCRMGCRKRAMEQLCGCVPYFYAKGPQTKFCNVIGLSCVADNMDRIMKPLKENICNCQPACNHVEYRLARISSTHWRFPAPFVIIFRWSIDSFSKTRTRRNVLFGLTDLLASFGGIAALFLGCSLISFVELIDFFVLRHFWKRIDTWASRKLKIPPKGRVRI